MESKKKILFIMPTLTGAGAERVICHIINNIDKDKFSPELLLVLHSDHKFLKNIRDGVNVHFIDSKSRLKFSVFHVLKWIFKIKPNTVFIGTGHLGLLLSPFVRLFPKYKWIVRETNFVNLNTEKGIARYFYRKFFKNYDMIIAQCNDMKNDLVRNFNINRNKITVINNPVDTDAIDFQLSRGDQNTVYPSDRINIVVCGRLTYQKGFDLLIEKYAFLSKENRSKYHITVIGEGEEDSRDVTKQLLDLSIKHELENCISFVGFKYNIYKWLENADIFILSSRFEGFPNILLEAIYCGSKALANNCPGGINEIIIDGFNGMVFDILHDNFNEKLTDVMEISTSQSDIKSSIKNRYGITVIIKNYEKIL